MPPSKRPRLLAPSPTFEGGDTCPRTGERPCFCASDALFAQGRWLDAAQSLVLLLPKPQPPPSSPPSPPPQQQQPCCALALRLGRAWLFAYKGSMRFPRRPGTGANCPDASSSSNHHLLLLLLPRAVAALRTAVATAIQQVQQQQEKRCAKGTAGRPVLAQARAAHHFLAEALSLQQPRARAGREPGAAQPPPPPPPVTGSAAATTAMEVHAQAVRHGLWREIS